MIRCQKSLLVVVLLFFFVSHGLSAEGVANNSPKVAQKELVILYDLDIGESLIASAGFFFACSSLLLVASRSSKLFYLALALELIMGGAFAGSLWFYKRIQDDTPIALLNEQGIWLEYYGTISWEDIEKLTIIQMPYSREEESIGVTIKEASLPVIKERVSQEGKWVKFYDADSYGCHIFLPTMSVPFERVLAFADRFIPSN